MASEQRLGSHQVRVRRIHRRDLKRVWGFLKRTFRDVNRLDAAVFLAGRVPGEPESLPPRRIKQPRPAPTTRRDAA
jgi:hypothetical protein